MKGWGTPALQGRGLVTVLLVAAFLWSLTSVAWDRDLVRSGGWSFLGQFASSLARPELSPDFLRTCLDATWLTVVYAVAGLTVALAIGLPLGALASGTLTRSTGTRWGSIAGVRLLLAGLRSVHELVWAWLFVVAIGLSPIAAILALGIPYGGILGRIFSEILRDVPQGPLVALRTTGASEVKVFLYGRLPMALPDMLSYTFYRLECAIRSAAIMSFIGIQGLGMQIQLSLDDLHYGEVWTLLFFLVALIAIIDAWSTMLRRGMVW